MEDYKIRTDIFEGPMDLLLHLVKINEVDIYEVSLSEITQQYLDSLRLMEQLDLEVAGEFVVMAATLVNIKLRSLLPTQREEEEEEFENPEDIMTAQQLLAQLIEYRKFKEAAGELHTREEMQTHRFFRNTALPMLVEAEESEELQLDLNKLLGSFGRVIRFVESRGYHQVHHEEYSVEDKIIRMSGRLKITHRLEVDELFRECQCKVEMIVVLLALLEMCRSKMIRIEQEAVYAPVFIERKESGANSTEESTPGEAKIVEVGIDPRGETDKQDEE